MLYSKHKKIVNSDNISLFNFKWKMSWNLQQKVSGFKQHLSNTKLKLSENIFSIAKVEDWTRLTCVKRVIEVVRFRNHPGEKKYSHFMFAVETWESRQSSFQDCVTNLQHSLRGRRAFEDIFSLYVKCNWDIWLNWQCHKNKVLLKLK